MAVVKIVDPVTRIEGHMKVEITVSSSGGSNEITDAKCTGTLFRGFETVLKGRDPKDAPILTERICGVCPVSHGMASVKAIEAVSAVKPPTNGRILRNLVLGSNFIQSHILHFYLLAAADFVPMPESNPWSPAWTGEVIENVDTRLVASHLGMAIEARRRAHEMAAVFAGRMPSPHTYVPGGFTSTPNDVRVGKFRSHLAWIINFIRNTYIPDVERLAAWYPDYLTIGKGYGNLLAFGVFDLDDQNGTKLLKPGFINASSTKAVQAVNLDSITEAVKYSWYRKSAPLNPVSGVTIPVDPTRKRGAYSWLKAPRHGGLPMEAGPLARMCVNGDYGYSVSVLDRHMARAKEALKVAEAMNDWLGRLITGSAVYNTYATPQSGSGYGLTEAPRGALGHWISIVGGKIDNYQVVTPTCWNASPRDDNDLPGPMEKALIGTPIAKPEEPIEALRVIHSFDPCLSCAVHVMKPNGEPVVLRAGIGK